MMLGDFNVGPDGELFDAEQPENYATLVAGDWSNPYTDDPVSECTFCADNPLIASDSFDGVAIDHVVVSGFDGTFEARPRLGGTALCRRRAGAARLPAGREEESAGVELPPSRPGRPGISSRR